LISVNLPLRRLRQPWRETAAGKPMKTMPLLLAACLAAGCASGPLVQTDRDPAVSFSAYRTFAWKQQPPIRNPLLKQRVVAAVEGQLLGKGWRIVAETDADVVLVGNVSAREEQSIEAFYDDSAWRDWGWRGYADASGGLRRIELRNYQVGTLVLDMFDARTKQAIWRATAEGTVPTSEARREKDAMSAVTRMFEDFPPPDPPSG
jgi:hypothetical protein